MFNGAFGYIRLTTYANNTLKTEYLTVPEGQVIDTLYLIKGRSTLKLHYWRHEVLSLPHCLSIDPLVQCDTFGYSSSGMYQ